MISEDLKRQLEGYSLTTAQIHFYYPDYPHVVSDNWILWQYYDQFPNFPALNKFLNFWLEEIHGRLNSVTVTHARLIKPAELVPVNGELRLH